MSWRKALWDKLADDGGDVTVVNRAADDGDVTVVDRAAETNYGAFENVEALKTNRRVEPRFTADEMPSITGVTISGEPVKLVNISASGMLVESNNRIKPGERVRLGFNGVTPNLVSGLVVRCVVASINNGGKLRYESGISFSDRVTLPAAVSAPAAAVAPAPAVASEPAVALAPAAAPEPAWEAVDDLMVTDEDFEPISSQPATDVQESTSIARRALPRLRNRW